jgi:xylan 1,4-beta-xylosidase
MKIASLLAIVSTTMAAAPSAINFESFEYAGRDPVFAQQLPPGHYRNPILAGFYPDPDICRIGDDYYLVNSSFAYFPGIPVFHSRDLVNWVQVGNVIDRPGQLDYRGIGVSRGIFAPALSHHGGLFYLICTFVDAGGNFYMTARDPAGPWSDPTWLPFDGIDPSLFFDDDGRAWVVSNGAPPGNKPLYSGHRAIYLQEFDSQAGKLVGPSRIIVDAGAKPADHPIWIEGPHLFKRDGWYFLICAEGGTAEQHSEVVFRSRNVGGPFVPGPANPILTQRTLPDSRPDPITCTGHADFVETQHGEWWSVFLGCRPYEGSMYNTGRETFMLPVEWTDGWPSILPLGAAVPYVAVSPNGASADSARRPPVTGNFRWKDDFAGPLLAKPWIGLRGMPEVAFASGSMHGLLLTPSSDSLWGNGKPAFIAHRIQHTRFTANTVLRAPDSIGVSAGLVAFQGELHHYFFGVRQTGHGQEVFVERLDGGPAETIARAVVRQNSLIMLELVCNGAACDFNYSPAPGEENALLPGADATLLSTQVAGGFVGAVVGLYARLDP